MISPSYSHTQESPLCLICSDRPSRFSLSPGWPVNSRSSLR